MGTDMKLYATSAILGVASILFGFKAIPLWSILSEVVYAAIVHISWTYILFGMSLLCTSAILFHIQSFQPAKVFPWYRVIIMYAFLQISRITSYVVLYYLKKGSKDIEGTQKKLLQKILNHAKDTAYFKESNMETTWTVSDFLNRHPITKYAHYEHFIKRAINGEGQVTVPEKISFIVATTGTTSGKSKLFPKATTAFFQLLLKDIFSYIYPLLNLPGAMDIKPIFDVGYKTKFRWTSRGLPICSLSSLYNDSFGELSAAPSSAKKIPDLFVSFYCQLLFAFKEREVCTLIFGFGSHGYTLLKMGADRWRDLVNDIKHGTINADVQRSIPPYLLNDMVNRLKPDPERAEELEAIFSETTVGYVRKVWPSASVIQCIVTGPFLIYRKLFEENYTADVPIFSWVHGSTESTFGLNLWPNQLPEEFVIMPNTVFYEFIDLDDYADEKPSTVLAHQVEIGKRYEIVVTTLDGLYRYRTNDVIEIRRFYHQAPVYIFIQRADDNLSVYAEKTPVSEMTAVLEKCSSEWENCDVTDYTFTESINVQDILTPDTVVVDHEEEKKMHYVVIIEINGNPPTKENIEQIDDKLRENIEAYDIYREKGRIGPVELLVTAPGAFARFRSMVLSRNADASTAQFKVPRVIRDKEKLDCLLSDC